MLSTAARVALAFLAVLHLAFLVLEMFLWRTPFGRRTFGLTRELAEETAALAANQGLYNGFLAAGLVWALFASEPRPVAIFFSACVLVAGLFGGFTAKRTILLVQALPGAVALALVLAS